MGYTHYWRRPKTFPKAAWEGFRADAWLLVDTWNREGAGRPDHSVAYEFDQIGKLPVVNDRLVRFNGVGEDGHETFMIPRTVPKEEWVRPSFSDDGKPKVLDFAFCKTARKSYDELVVACLVALKKHFPVVQVSSDGDNTEWTQGADAPGVPGGVAFCQRVLEYGKEFVMKDGDEGLVMKLTVRPVAAV